MGTKIPASDRRQRGLVRDERGSDVTTPGVVAVEQGNSVDAGDDVALGFCQSPILQDHFVRCLGHVTERRVLQGGCTGVGWQSIQQDNLKMGFDIRQETQGVVEEL